MRPLVLTAALCVGLAGLGGLTTPAEAQDATAVASGTFQAVSARYSGGGSATIAETAAGETVVQLGSNFSVTPGPDLEVWLVADAAPATNNAVLASTYVSLGALQSPTGAQTYSIPADVDVSAYGSVVIWCEDFSVLFTVATLQ
jgi:hypothetical protein